VPVRRLVLRGFSSPYEPVRIRSMWTIVSRRLSDITQLGYARTSQFQSCIGLSHLAERGANLAPAL